jgi:hypothetical protein
MFSEESLYLLFIKQDFIRVFACGITFELLILWQDIKKGGGEFFNRLRAITLEKQLSAPSYKNKPKNCNCDD